MLEKINLLKSITDKNIMAKMIIALLIFLVFIIIRKIFKRYIYKILRKACGKTTNQLDDKMIDAFEKPVMAIFLIVGVFLSFRYISWNNYVDLLLAKSLRISVIVIITWGLYNFSNTFIEIFVGVGKKLDIKIDNIVAPFISKVLKVVIVLFASVLIVSEFGYNVSGLIAGLGLGGLAFALAAQDTLSNIFGGLVIIIDRPFSIGDWIYSPSVEGTVEDITFRSTRVRTFANAIVIVPNSKLANEPITNWTKMGKRRITFNIGVTYETSKNKIQKCSESIKSMLKKHDEVHPETIFVRFDKFNNYSLDIFVYFFTNTTDWEKFLEVKEDINYKVMDIMENENIEFAFPSQSIYVEQMPK